MCLTIQDVSDHVHMPCDSPANTTCEADYGALSAAHCTDAVEGALNTSSVVTAEVPHCLLRRLQVFPSDLHQVSIGGVLHPDMVTRLSYRISSTLLHQIEPDQKTDLCFPQVFATPNTQESCFWPPSKIEDNLYITP